MCGIAGIVDTSGVPDRRALEQARDLLIHRGPDAAGLAINRRGDAALLFRRLSIIDLTAAGSQPLDNDDGSRSIVFNGEVYNFESLRQVLEGLGHRFRSGTDTEVVLRAHEEWGDDCVHRFIGMFAFAIWDDRTRTLFAARDRLGIKPFYYQQTSTGLRFASELKALAALPGSGLHLDEAALWQYLASGYVSPPRTIYREARSLPPAHRLRWSAGTADARIERYWDPLEAYRRGVAPRAHAPAVDDVVEELDELLRAAVKLRLRSDVPVGAFLSGGVDSSTVASIMTSVAASRVKTFTIGFEDRRYDEAAAAQEIASHLGTDHSELLATEQEALEFIPRIPEHYDEPFADSSAIPTYLACLLARRHVTVALSGDGGDELFGGYQHYRSIGTRLRLARAVPPASRGWLTQVGERLPDSRAQIALASLGRASAGAEPFFDYFVSIWRPYELRRLAPGLSPGPQTGASRVNGSATDLEVFTLSDLQRYLPHDILTKIDRASMAVSLEARVPLLDHRVVEFVLALPRASRMNEGGRKSLLRMVLARYLPPGLTERPKRGFSIPIDAWLRGPLAWMLHEYLSDARVRGTGLFEPRVVRRTVDRFLRGHIGHARPWVLLMYQMWAEKYRFA